MNELEKDIDLAGILQNDRIKEEYRFLDFKGSPTDRIKKYAPLIKEEIIRMQDYSTDTEEYSAAWDKMNFLLDKYTQAVGELVPFSEDELSTPCVCKNQEDVLKQINELMDYSMEQDISENNLKISEKLTLIYPLGYIAAWIIDLFWKPAVIQKKLQYSTIAYTKNVREIPKIAQTFVSLSDPFETIIFLIPF